MRPVISPPSTEAIGDSVCADRDERRPLSRAPERRCFRDSGGCKTTRHLVAREPSKTGVPVDTDRPVGLGHAVYQCFHTWSSPPRHTTKHAKNTNSRG